MDLRISATSEQVVKAVVADGAQKRQSLEARAFCVSPNPAHRYKQITYSI